MVALPIQEVTLFIYSSDPVTVKIVPSSAKGGIIILHTCYNYNDITACGCRYKIIYSIHVLG